MTAGRANSTTCAIEVNSCFGIEVGGTEDAVGIGGEGTDVGLWTRFSDVGLGIACTVASTAA